MADGWNARPVSGEIMTATAAAVMEPPARPARGADIVDAQFEPIVPGERTGSRAARHRRRPAAPPQGMDVLRRIEPRSERAGYNRPFFLLAVVMLAMIAFWISGGHVLLSLDSLAIGLSP